MPAFLSLSLLLILTAMVSRAQEPWPGVPFTEVRAYAWESSADSSSQRRVSGGITLAEGMVNPEGVRLSAAQVQRLLAAEARRHRPRLTTGGDYDPHHAFVFYDADHQPVAFLEVSFGSFTTVTGPYDQEADPDFLALAKLCRELRLLEVPELNSKRQRENYEALYHSPPPAKPEAKPFLLRPKHPWPGIRYTEVRAYAWKDPAPPDHLPDQLINDDLTLVRGAVDPAGVRLNRRQVARLLTAEANRHHPLAVSMCYEPHHAFVFYNALHRPVAFLEVCFDCLACRLRPLDKEASPNLLTLAQLCTELQLPGVPDFTTGPKREEYDMVFGLGQDALPRKK